MKEYNSNNPDPADIYAGQALKKVRLYNRMSQEKLANMLDVKFQQVQKYENATNRISASKLNKICEIFNVSSDLFMKSKTYGEITMDDAQIKIAGKLSKLDENQKLAVLAIINNMKG